MKKLIFILITLFNFTIFARQPAVLPGRTLSTAQYDNNQNRNDKFQGYKFSKIPTKSENVINQNLEKVSAAGPQSISIYLTIFALLFPFGLWLINNRSLKDENEIINKDINNQLDEIESFDNVIELGIGQNDSNLNDDNEGKSDQKKAS